MSYTIRRIAPCALGKVDFSKADSGHISCVWHESGKNRPKVEFRILHDDASLYIRYVVREDRGVLVRHRGFQVPVHLDSCCEIFVRPKLGCGYFNFEMNAGGSLTLMYIEDPSRIPGGFKKAVRLPDELCAKVEIIHTLPQLVPQEMPGPTDWELRCRIPFSIFEKYVGKLDPKERNWLGSLFSCCEEGSEPYWQSWTPIPTLNFHNVLVFRDLILEGAECSGLCSRLTAADLPEACRFA